MVNTGETARAATVWVDTNVMLEVYSHGDLFDAGERGDDDAIEARRWRMQGSLWMVMALCQRLVRSLTYRHENERNILRMAPPGSNRGVHTSAILYIIGDGGVFEGWEADTTNIGAELNNPARDRLMVEQCRETGMVLVSRDQGVLDLAEAEGVSAMLPEGYAMSVFPRDRARAMFLERLRVACDWYPSSQAPENRERAVASAQVVWELYERLWMPAGSVERRPL